MNLALYGHAGAWLMVDLGITFAGDQFPDYDVMMADPAFIERHRDRLVGLVLSHAHEDHVGALPYLWRRLRCPVYATPFTAAVATYKLANAAIGRVRRHRGPAGRAPGHWPLRRGAGDRHPLHPRAQRGADPHPGRVRLPHRRTGNSTRTRAWADPTTGPGCAPWRTSPT